MSNLDYARRKLVEDAAKWHFSRQADYFGSALLILGVVLSVWAFWVIVS